MMTQWRALRIAVGPAWKSTGRSALVDSPRRVQAMTSRQLPVGRLIDAVSFSCNGRQEQGNDSPPATADCHRNSARATATRPSRQIPELGYEPSGQPPRALLERHRVLERVELVFDIDPGLLAHYDDVRPRQWSGPEAVYFKKGPPFTSPWHTALNDRGTGPDDPLPESRRTTAQSVVYDDAPGPVMSGRIKSTWVHAVQNFTGWVEGRPRTGGPAQQHCEVVPWHSVISVANPEAEANGGSGAQAWQVTGFTRSGTGWVPLGPAPI